MALTSADKLHQTCLLVLEIVVLALYVVCRVADLSFLGLWVYWLAMMFFWLIVLLFVASLRMFSKHRLLAMIGLGMVAVVVVTAILSGFFTEHR